MLKRRHKPTAVTGFWEHSFTNLALAIGLIVIRCLLKQNPIQIDLFGMFISTVLMSPDMDSSRAVVYKNWLILRWLWYPYTAIFKHQGSSHNLIFEVNRGIGHNIILGTALRIIYASALLLLLTIIIRSDGDMIYYTKLLIANKPVLKQLIFGIWLADFSHIMLDYFVHSNDKNNK